MEMEDFLKALMKEGLGEEATEEIFEDMKARTRFAYDVVRAFTDGGVRFSEWLYENKGEIGVVQLLLPKGMADGLREIGESHKERCEGCSRIEGCKRAGIYDDPIRAAMTEIFKLGFSELAEQVLKRRS